MGKLEKSARERRRWGQVKYGVLAAVGISGLLLVSMAAPNTLQLLKYVPKNKYRFRNQANSILSQLATEGKLRFVEMRGKKHAELTDKGRRELTMLRQKFETLGSKKRRWDKRWRVVIFDIPEKVRHARIRLRDTMQSFGFQRLQDSVWVYPYDCEDVIALLKTELGLGKAVVYMIVESIENDHHLREDFGLPLYS